MLIIVTNGTTEDSLHMGGSSYLKALRETEPVSVEVQADGHELNAIAEQFINIAMHNGRVVKWTGETARFIFNNLKL